ncbi:MAG: sugar phosphate isomerase/epimerase [Candidatus Latescibacteria bacterium]|nr:sugar phosphate isomerase/epimerase [Candidatus Latescibacterota bacterium]
MKLGCSTILYGGHDLDIALDRIKAIGYRAVELCALPGMAPHLNLGESVAYYQDVKSRVSDRGLAIESIGASGTFGDRSKFLQVLDAAVAVGAPLVTTGAGGKMDDAASFKEVVRAVNDVVGECRARKVKLSVKPHVNNAVYDTDTAHRFMQEVDRAWVGLNYDPTHVWRNGKMETPEQTVGKISEYILSLRIRDVKGRQTSIGPVEGQIAPNGDLNLPALMKEFKKIQGVEYAVLEIVGTKDYAVAQVDDVVQRSFDYFSTLLA